MLMKVCEAYSLIRFLGEHYVRLLEGKKPVFIYARGFILLLALYFSGGTAGSISGLAEKLGVDVKICHITVHKLRELGLVSVKKHSRYAIVSLKPVAEKALEKMERKKDPLLLTAKSHLKEIYKFI